MGSVDWDTLCRGSADWDTLCRCSVDWDTLCVVTLIRSFILRLLSRLPTLAVIDFVLGGGGTLESAESC